MHRGNKYCSVAIFSQRLCWLQSAAFAMPQDDRDHERHEGAGTGSGGLYDSLITRIITIGIPARTRFIGVGWMNGHESYVEYEHLRAQTAARFDWNWAATAMRNTRSTSTTTSKGKTLAGRNREPQTAEDLIPRRFFRQRVRIAVLRMFLGEAPHRVTTI